jgi:tetratricopeptide (TPR) repeat protein
MTFTRELRHQILDPALSTDERAGLRCRLAKHLEEIGQYEAAREAMDDLWPTVGGPPNLHGLEQQTAAEVLLRVGTLTGWIGSIKQIQGAQETAKNLLTQSIARFASLRDDKKVAEAQTELGYCYLREGNLNNARVWFAEALSRLDDEDGDLKALALLRSALLEQLANRLIDALDILKKAAPLFEKSNNHPLKGKFHNELATVLKNLGAIENRSDYINRALLEYAAASFHFEQAGHDRYQSYVENNLAMLFFQARQFEEAHEHLDRAQALFTTLEDAIHLAQVYDTRARVFVAEGLYVKAEEVARWAVQLLGRGEQHSLLAEALTTHGITLSRLHHKDQARAVFERAIRVAEHADDSERAGLAALTLVEELSEHLTEDEQYFILERADDRLENTQNTDLLRRQKNCFRRFAARTFLPDLTTFSLEEAVHQYEERHIRRALEKTGGVTHAARLLKISRQGLYKILNTRHQNLRQLGSGEDRKV